MNTTPGLNASHRITPQVHPLKSSTQILRVFSVPSPGSVGTFDYNKSAALIMFKGSDMKFSQMRPFDHDFPLKITQSGVQPLNSEECAYTCGTDFVRFSISKAKYTGYFIGIERWPEQFCVLDNVEPVRVLFRMENNLLRIIQCATPDFLNDVEYGDFTEAVHLKPSGPYRFTDHSIRDKHIFVYSDDDHRFLSLDFSLKETGHPLSILLNDQKIEGSEWVIHPSLPFAFIHAVVRAPSGLEFASAYFLARWLESEKKQRCIPVTSVKKGSQFTLSPDGAWLVYFEYDKSVCAHDDNPALMAIPVGMDPSAPLGATVILGGSLSKNAGITSMAWISSPSLSLVATDGKYLYKWDFKNIPR